MLKKQPRRATKEEEKKREERMDRENERARVPLVMSFGGRSEFGYLIRERERTGSNETIV